MILNRHLQTGLAACFMTSFIYFSFLLWPDHLWSRPTSIRDRVSYKTVARTPQSQIRPENPEKRGTDGRNESDQVHNYSLPENSALNNFESEEAPKETDTTPARRNTTAAAVINPHNFRYVLNNDKLCDVKIHQNTSVLILIFVQSSAGKPKPRQLIRETWGSVRAHGHYTVRIVFMLGLSSSTEQQVQISAESAQYGDIVQEDFMDHYRNLSRKHIMAMKWINTFCGNAKFIVKADDDTFVNMHQLFRFFDKQHLGATDWLYCSVYVNIGPRRDETDKWYVSFDEYQDDVYPPYCEGFAYVMSPDLPLKLYNASLDTKYYWIDDVYVTGILARKLGLQHSKFIRNFGYDQMASPKNLTDTQTDFLFVLFKYFRSQNHQESWEDLWRRIDGALRSDLENQPN